LIARVTQRAAGAEHSSLITLNVDRITHAAATAAADVGWLLLVPVVAVLFLSNRGALIDGTVHALSRRQDRASVKHTVEQVDTILAEYVRGQLVLAGMSAAFYSVSMAILGFPYPLVLGALGGALEFVPVVGWLIAASLMVASGWAAQAPWIWMAGLAVIWRVIQAVVNSPRVMGSQLQMEPLTVMFALIAGGQLGGFLGVILSVPAAAVVRILWLDRVSRQKAVAA
jgi:predicted PurR-regulated permease PerM